MPRGKKSVKIKEPVVNEAETKVAAEEVKTTVEVTANPETTEPENVTITRDESGEVISVQPTQELIDQQNAEVEKKEEEEEKPEEEKPEEETEENEEETETEKVENPVNENELFLNNDSLEAAELQKDNSVETEKPEEEKTESTVATTNSDGSVIYTKNGTSTRVDTNPFGRKTISYEPIINKEGTVIKAKIVLGKRGETRIRPDGTEYIR